MSRIGNLPIPVPAGVNIALTKDNVKVTGPKGELNTQLTNKYVSVKLDEDTIVVSRSNELKSTKSYHGLVRSLISNMITGVTEGFKKSLTVEGVGFKVNLNGNKLKMSLGFSHDVEFVAPDGITLTVDGMNITVEGIDKQLVGQTAAVIREFKKPEPYKGKGIRYDDEYIIRKAGKTAGAGAE